MAYTPKVSGPEERARSRQRLALLDLKTGALSEFRTLDPGDQIGSRANDGRYLAFVEIGVLGAKAPDWRLFVRDMDSGDTWEVDRALADEAPGDAPGIALFGPWLDVSNGTLAYDRYRRQETGDWLYEITVVDLAGRSPAVVASHSTSAGYVNSLSVANGTLYWLVRFHPLLADATASLHELALQAPGETETPVNAALLQIAATPGKVFASSATGVFGWTDSRSFEQVATTNGLPMNLSVSNDIVAWLDTGTQHPMAMDIRSKAVSEIDSAATVSLFTDDHLVAWETRAGVLRWLVRSV